MRKSTMILAVLVFAACGEAEDKANGADNSGVAEDSCVLSMPLTGAVEQVLDWGDSEGCAGATSGSLVTLTFGAFGGDSVVIGTVGFMFGELGPVEAYVQYRNADDDEWTAQDCTLELSRNEVVETDPDFGDTYGVAGSGTCTDAASVTAGEGDAEVLIGEFTFASDRVPGPN